MLIDHLTLRDQVNVMPVNVKKDDHKRFEFGFAHPGFLPSAILGPYNAWIGLLFRGRK